MAEEEIWKTYPEILFIEASNLGRIRTKDRTVKVKGRGERLIKGRVLKQLLHKNGYMYVAFTMNGKSFCLRVHRIVATCFIPNPNNLPEVNHIDNNPANNDASNLEWCTRKYNEAYKKNFGTSSAKVLGRPVIAVNFDTSEVFWFESQSEVARQLGVHAQHISMVVKGRVNMAKNYYFCNADSTAVEKTRSKFSDKIANKVEKLMREHI